MPFSPTICEKIDQVYTTKSSDGDRWHIVFTFFTSFDGLFPAGVFSATTHRSLGLTLTLKFLIWLLFDCWSVFAIQKLDMLLRHAPWQLLYLVLPIENAL